MRRVITMDLFDFSEAKIPRIEYNNNNREITI